MKTCDTHPRYLGLRKPRSKCQKCVELFELKNATCNLCGLTCNLEGDIPRKFASSYGLINASVSGGFDSTPGNGQGALDDMTQYQFSLCEFCLDWLFERCKVPPRVTDYIDYRDESFRPAAERVAKDEWRKQKTIFFVEKEQRDKARNDALRVFYLKNVDAIVA